MSTATDITTDETPRERLERLLTGSPYQAYAYSYPHKTAYRPFEQPYPLEELWAREDQSALFLYAHVPFCEMRCGFCNLFTMARPKQPLAETYMTALRRQAVQVRQALGEDASFARVAIGGGTPTQLDEPAFEELFDVLEGVMGADLTSLPVSCEMSPETVTRRKLEIMIERGVTRASIGVQSFLEAETKAVRRPQKREDVLAALTMIREAGFEVFNLDLIYGMPKQTAETWRTSLEEAMRFSPEEIFLYPLYVRPLTGLDNSKKSWDDHRLDLYRQGRDFLLERGYEQLSMRLFRRPSLDVTEGPVYRCQQDGMVGLGAGARSYTDRLHYSSEYAVGRRGVVSIIEDFVQRPDERFAQAEYGFSFDGEDRRRRFAVMSLLSHEGLDPAFYHARFGTLLSEDMPWLDALEERDLARRDAQGILRLTDDGLERSDVIGPWLDSPRVEALKQEFELQ